MEKIINFWFISTVCAVAWYIVDLICGGLGLFWPLLFVALVLLLISCMVAPDSSDVESVVSRWNALFSLALVMTTAAIEYGIVYKFTGSPLFSIPTALVCGIFAVYFLQNFRKGLLSDLK
mgnify:CR=1 FL=1